MLTVLLLSLCLELKADLDEFSLFVKDASKVSIEFSNQMPIVYDVVSGQCRKAHAICDMWTNTIVLNSTFWKTGNRWQKKKVLFHELGHCVVGLKHPSNPYEYTIMNSSLDTAKKDGSNWQELFDELIQRSKYPQYAYSE